jgi:septal ring factor EnvC (AmiA/AmiB activator)
LAELTEQANSAKVYMSALPPKLAKIEGQKIERVLENINDKSRALDKQRSEAQWDSLFTTLAAWKSGENEDVALPDTFEQLPKRFQSLFKQSNTAPADRKAITIQAEVLHDLPSNKADEKQRKELQLQMMASKLEGNEPQTLQTLLADWVSHGPLQKEDQALLKRLKKVFEAQ